MMEYRARFELIRADQIDQMEQIDIYIYIYMRKSDRLDGLDILDG